MKLSGIWAAVLTPVGPDLQPDATKAIAYYRDLLANGCDGINLLGTTGEAMSFGADVRLEFMEAIAGALPRERVMAGTGAASLDDAVRLTRGAIELGFAAALVMPPFFYRDATDDGILRFFEELFRRIGTPKGGRPTFRTPILLYNFPQMSGIRFGADLVDRLLTAFPERIAGIKDSSNDRVLQREILARHREFAVFPGSESYLDEALAYGTSGCISGSVALWPELSQSVYRDALREKNASQSDSTESDASPHMCHPERSSLSERSRRAPEMRELTQRRATLDGLPFIPAVRYLTARMRADDAWERSMPPLVRLTLDERTELDRRLDLATL